MPAPHWYVHTQPCPECGELHTGCASHPHGDRERPCNRPVKPGNWLCSSHGAGLIKVQPEMDMQETIETHLRFGQILRDCEVQVRGRSYPEALEDAMHRANTMVASLYILVQTLKPRSNASSETVAAGGGREVVVYSTAVDEEGLVGPNHEGDLAVHPWVILYGEWVERQARIAKLASDLGLEERSVRVQEGQLKLMAAAMFGILRELGIDPQSDKARGVIEAHLLTLDTAEISMAKPGTGVVTSS